MHQKHPAHIPISHESVLRRLDVLMPIIAKEGRFCREQFDQYLRKATKRVAEAEVTGDGEAYRWVALLAPLAALSAELLERKIGHRPDAVDFADGYIKEMRKNVKFEGADAAGTPESSILVVGDATL